MMTQPTQKEFGSLSMKLDAVQQFHHAKIMEYHAALKLGNQQAIEAARLTVIAAQESVLDVMAEHMKMIRRINGVDDA